MYLSAACPEWARMPPLTATCMLCISCLPAAAAAAGDGADGAGTDELFFDTTGDEPAIFIGLEGRLRPEAVRAADPPSSPSYASAASTRKTKFLKCRDYLLCAA